LGRASGRSLSRWCKPIEGSSSVASGYKSVLRAMDETHVTGNEGIVEHDLDRTIDNLCSIASKSMHHIDRQVIEIMVSKPCP